MDAEAWMRAELARRTFVRMLRSLTKLNEHEASIEWERAKEEEAMPVRYPASAAATVWHKRYR